MLATVPAVNTLDAWITLDAEPGVAPGRLERIRALLNTDDRFNGAERLGPEAPPELRALRDALRAYVVAGERRALDQVAARHPLVLRLTAEGPGLAPSDEHDEVAALLADVLGEHGAGRLHRLKACSNPACQWLYYDASRNRSGRWCSMGECGDVMKARAYRARSRTAGQGPAPADGTASG